MKARVLGSEDKARRACSPVSKLLPGKMVTQSCGALPLMASKKDVKAT